eukprot:2204819-Amphidinium_carterae.2
MRKRERCRFQLGHSCKYWRFKCSSEWRICSLDFQRSSWQWLVRHSVFGHIVLVASVIAQSHDLLRKECCDWAWEYSSHALLCSATLPPQRSYSTPGTSPPHLISNWLL